MQALKQLLCISTLAVLGSLAHAAPLHYLGDLTDGAWHLGEVGNDSNRSYANYSFWRFEANAGDRLSVTALRDEYYHDPVMRIWFGLFGDTSDLGRSLYFADDTLSNPGPYGDPQASFVASSGFYTVGVYDHSAGGYRCDGPCSYRVSAQGSSVSVPEPASMTLVGMGLVFLVMLRRRLALAKAAKRELYGQHGER